MVKRISFTFICIVIILLTGTLLFVTNSRVRAKLADSRTIPGSGSNSTGNTDGPNGTADPTPGTGATYGSSAGAAAADSGFDFQEGNFIDGAHGPLSGNSAPASFAVGSWGGGSLFADSSSWHSHGSSDSNSDQSSSGPGGGPNTGGGFGGGSSPSIGQNTEPAPSVADSKFTSPGRNTGNPVAVPDESSTCVLLSISLIALAAFAGQRARPIGTV